MKTLAALIGLVGGLGLFIYGMQMCSEGLQKLAAHRLKQLVKVLTSNPILGVFMGTVITVGLQSSSATSALVVGFVSARLMTLAQALGVLLGSALGASLTVQLIAFKVTELALALLFIGAIAYMFSKRSRQRSVGQTILGCGLLFYGMFVMSNAMAPFREYPLIVQSLVSLEHYPVFEFLVALLITAIIQSSPAFLALLMTLAMHHLVGPYAIVPFVLGAHLGGTVTGVISSLGTPGRDAKRAALSNFAFKLICGAVFLPFAKPLTDLILWSSPDIQRQIANAHTFFSLMMVLGFLPFTAPVAAVMRRFIPDRAAAFEDAVYLDESVLAVPELAVDQAHRQTIEMGRIVSEEMLARSVPVLSYGNDDIMDRIDEIEPAIDVLYQKISHYVTSLGNNGISEELMQRSIQILYVANDLEHMGDIMVNVAKQARKILSEEVEFSEEGLEELQKMHRQVSDNFRHALKAFETSDKALATRIIKEHPKIIRLEKELRYNHFDRMQAGNQKSMATSGIHLDLIEAMLRIDAYAVNIAQVVVGIV